MTVKECTGDCCREFPVCGMSMAQIIEIANGNKVDPDGAKLVAMLIPLDRVTGGQPLFTCRHWNAETKRCMDYENRPGMCSDYPYYSGRCPACGGSAS